ncbi:MAG: type II toxin-antitoxin system RelE/ParE family toxin [Alphaproteobacteria bacterium]
MRDVHLSTEALDDLDSIAAYIAKNNQHAAARVVDRVEAMAQQLAFMPVGRRGRVAGTFEMVVTGLPYILCYTLSDESLTVVRVIHGARNWGEGEWPD